jgi:predicted nucleic acid-binding protein
VAPPLILDSGAVMAIAAGDRRGLAFLKRAVENEAMVLVPAVVVAETTRGGPRDAPVNRLLKEIDEVPRISKEMARAAGRLLGRAGSAATIDALVVATADAAGGGLVLTSDPKDLQPLASQTAAVAVVDI